MNILVVDDDMDIREMLTLFLEKIGHRPIGLRHGREALEAIWRTVDVDLVICDLMMPELDGYQLISHLREAGCALPIIVVTGANVPDLLTGADRVLRKPIHLSQLQQAITDCLAPSG